ncbi:hypothetical protein Nepgr_008581 [Nepenthes gracilis]|uniref:Fe2OG dioxygenase domain-containing protein n=1 Tax=Nepenthes gracilis TaxID=150966 RepID=A0AAD3SA03_NEPGR|nr:hypothetical protein Nepgr_008581 [Nepenthes gracilis]
MNGEFVGTLSAPAADGGDSISGLLRTLEPSEILEVLSNAEFCSHCQSLLTSQILKFIVSKNDGGSFANKQAASEGFWTSSEEFSTEEILHTPSTQKSIASSTDSNQQQSDDRTISRTKGSSYLLRQKWKTANSSPASFNSMHRMLDVSDAETSLARGESGTSSALKDGLVDEQKEWLRFSQVVQRKDFVHYERINGKEINVLQGLELHTGVFDVEEQKNIVEYVYKLQKIGRKGQLRARTYSEPRKWMRGKGRVTIQFGCCYNYAVDKDGNPPGIIRDEEVDPLPSMFKQIIKRMVRWHILPPSCVPNSCIVNIYDEGDCIPPHIDHHDFLRPFCTVSFLSKCNILFGLNLKIAGPGEFSGPVSIPLPVGSVMILNGNGADIAKHCVPAVPTKRISITFRKMDDSKLPFAFLHDPDLLNIKPLGKSSTTKSPVQHLRSQSSSNGHANGREISGNSFAFLNDDDFPPLGGLNLRKQ